MGEKLGFYESKIQLKNGQWLVIEPVAAYNGMGDRYVPSIAVRSGSAIHATGDVYTFKDKEYLIDLEFKDAVTQYERGIHRGKWFLVLPKSAVLNADTGKPLKSDHEVFVSIVATAKAALNRWQESTPEWRKVSAHRRVLELIDDREIRIERIKKHLAESMQEFDDLKETRSILEAEIPDWLE